jgi:hypothetical protein
VCCWHWVPARHRQQPGAGSSWESLSRPPPLLLLKGEQQQRACSEGSTKTTRQALGLVHCLTSARNVSEKALSIIHPRTLILWCTCAVFVVCKPMTSASEPSPLFVLRGTTTPVNCVHFGFLRLPPNTSAASVADEKKASTTGPLKPCLISGSAAASTARCLPRYYLTASCLVQRWRWECPHMGPQHAPSTSHNLSARQIEFALSELHFRRPSSHVRREASDWSGWVWRTATTHACDVF